MAQCQKDLAVEPPSCPFADTSNHIIENPSMATWNLRWNSLQNMAQLQRRKLNFCLKLISDMMETVGEQCIPRESRSYRLKYKPVMKLPTTTSATVDEETMERLTQRQQEQETDFDYVAQCTDESTWKEFWFERSFSGTSHCPFVCVSEISFESIEAILCTAEAICNDASIFLDDTQGHEKLKKEAEALLKTFARLSGELCHRSRDLRFLNFDVISQVAEEMHTSHATRQSKKKHGNVRLVYELMGEFERVYVRFEQSIMSRYLTLRTSDVRDVSSPSNDFEGQQLLTVLESQSLLYALARGFVTDDEVDEISPNVLFALSRMAILYGCQEGLFSRTIRKEEADSQDSLVWTRYNVFRRDFVTLEELQDSIHTLSGPQRDDLWQRIVTRDSREEDDTMMHALFLKIGRLATEWSSGSWAKLSRESAAAVFRTMADRCVPDTLPSSIPHDHLAHAMQSSAGHAGTSGRHNMIRKSLSHYAGLDHIKSKGSVKSIDRSTTVPYALNQLAVSVGEGEEAAGMTDKPSGATNDTGSAEMNPAIRPQPSPHNHSSGRGAM